MSRANRLHGLPHHGGHQAERGHDQPIRRGERHHVEYPAERGKQCGEQLEPDRQRHRSDSVSVAECPAPRQARRRTGSASRLQRGEYANETHFITQVDALDQAVIEVLPQAVQGLAVMSDGLIRLALKMPSQEPHTPFFQPLFQFARAAIPEAEAVRQLEAFLQSERVNARTDDDKTLVLAIRKAATAGAAAQKPVEHAAVPVRA